LLPVPIPVIILQHEKAFESETIPRRGDRMTIVLLLLGIFVGGALNGFTGALLGGGLGYVIATLIHLHQRLNELEKTVFGLRRGQPSVRYQPGTEAPPEESSATGTTGTFSPPPPSTASHEAPAAAPPPGNEQFTEPAYVPREKRGMPDSLLRLVSYLFSGEALLVKVGILILFFGVSFLVKYAAEHSLLPIEIRLAAAAAGGTVLLALGWKLRARRENYAHVMQGGGVGILYLTTFAALRLYALLPAGPGFGLLAGIALFSSILAVVQNARPLAILGATGGFLAPILASTGGGNHVILFSYYAVLNATILGIAWFRAWRFLNLVGFTFTFAIGTFWGLNNYRAADFVTTEPFLVLFFVMYTAVSILFALRQQPELRGYIDGTLVFGTPIVAFALQGILVTDYRYGLAFSAFALGMYYLAISSFLFFRKPAFTDGLAEAFFAFGIIFCTLTVPLAVDDRWTAAAWALEGAGIVWAGARQQRKLVKAFGILLLFAAGGMFLDEIGVPTGPVPVLNGFFLGCVQVSVAAFFGALCLYRNRSRSAPFENEAAIALFAWGLLWWFGGGIHEIDRHVADPYATTGLLLFFTFSAFLSTQFERRLRWPWLSFPALALLAEMLVCALLTDDHPSANLGFAAWPAAFAIFYLILRRHDDLPEPYLKLLHSGALWLLTGLCGWELYRQLEAVAEESFTWPALSWGLVPAFLVLIVAKAGAKVPWPTGRHLKIYLNEGAGPLALFLLCWTLFSDTLPGDTPPLPYLPFFNALDLVVIFVFAAMAIWFVQPLSLADLSTRSKRFVIGGWAAAVFVWLNAVLARTVHHWQEVDFSPVPLFHSVVLQASLSIFWSLLALCSMLYATRRSFRTVWLGGAGLLASVVLKLFLVDLSNTGTVARIISFVGVGVLLLIIGYFSPVPPRVNDRERSKETKPTADA
jgi:uncharacterized membrane protein